MQKRSFDSLRRVNQVIWPKSFRYVFRSLTDEEAGQLVKAVYATWASRSKMILPENKKIYLEYREIMAELNHAAERYLGKLGRYVEDDEDDEDDDEDYEEV